MKALMAAKEEGDAVLSFVQFGKQYQQDPMLMAALKLVALHEKHALTEWIARLKTFGEQAA